MLGGGCGQELGFPPLVCAGGPLVCRFVQAILGPRASAGRGPALGTCTCKRQPCQRNRCRDSVCAVAARRVVITGVGLQSSVAARALMLRRRGSMQLQDWCACWSGPFRRLSWHYSCRHDPPQQRMSIEDD